MIFSLEQLICDISHHFSLNPGDVILSGTPSGVSQLLSGDVLKASLFIENRSELGVETYVR